MFTGIVECTGQIVETREVSGGRHLRVHAGPMAGECVLGASVCVNGVCLTVTAVNGEDLSFDVVAETVNKSTLAAKRRGDSVNLERSLRLSDRLDGHFVQGHVDGTAVVDRVIASDREHVVWLRPDSSLTPFLIPKGSVTVDGVSLTIAAVEGGLFSIALIPTTLERTALKGIKSGNSVNIESDIITRTIVHRLSELSNAGGLSLESLRAGGFA